MKGSRTGFNGGGGGGAPLVCFPSRAHLTLMPKPICSPSRQNSDPSKRSQPRPLFLTRTQTTTNKTQFSSDIGSEPTSPKVTCAGQIKVRHKNQNRSRRHPKNWVESLGLKKDVMNFLGALRSLRFNMHCFGSFHGAVDCCSDEEDEEEEQEDVGGSHSRNVFSKWFMLLEEKEEEEEADDECEKEDEEEEQEEEEGVLTPPKNALLLMRCRSAPAKGWLGAEEEVKEVVVEKEEGDEERLMLMSYAPDFFKVSTEIAKETWVVGSVDPLARSRSWKR